MAEVKINFEGKDYRIFYQVDRITEGTPPDIITLYAYYVHIEIPSIAQIAGEHLIFLRREEKGAKFLFQPFKPFDPKEIAFRETITSALPLPTF